MIAKRLKKGDTIGLVSPAGPEDPDKIKASIEYLKAYGFKIKEGKHVYSKLGYLAGSDSDRAEDLMNMFLDREVDMVLCVRGGYGTMRILPQIDFNIIRENPKIFAGFSDITTLLNNIFLKCNLVTFHAPMCNSNFSDKYTISSFLDTLMLGFKPFVIKNPKNIPTRGLNSDSVEGVLVGGNLSLICSTLGTPFEIDTRNKILFIEDIGEEPYKLDRMLTQLLLSNKLQQCAGIILGQFTDCELPHYERSLTLEEVLEDRVFSLGRPTLVNLQSGHSYPKLTLPIGAPISINLETGSIEVLEAVVS